MKYLILVKNANEAKDCLDNKNLMNSLASKSELAPRGCHNGACGVCKIQVHKGEYKKDLMNRKHISQEEEQNNIVLACKTYPRSNMDIEFLHKKKKDEYYLGDKF